MLLPKPFQHAWMDAEIDAFREQVRRYIERELAPCTRLARSGLCAARDLARLWRIWLSAARDGRAMGRRRWQSGLSVGGAGRADQGRDSRHHQRAHHRLALPRHLWAEGKAALAAQALQRRAAGRHRHDRAQRGLRPQGHAHTAQRDGEHYVINGSKTFITNGYTANLLVVAVRTGDAGSGGIAGGAGDGEPARLSRGPQAGKIGQHISDTAELFFEDLRIPASHLLGGTEGQGFKQLMSQLPSERMLLGSAPPQPSRWLGTDRGLHPATQGIRPDDCRLPEHAFKLAECATTAHVVRSFVNDCIQRLLDGTLDNEAAYMAKWWCSEQQCKVMDECLQLFGGYGYMEEYPIARLYTDARIQKIYGGANEIMKDLIARRLFAQ
jgi:acyl-CoA dehydrogenase